jgi:hypothetical protein
MKILEKEISRDLDDTINYKVRKELTNELYGDYQSLLKIRLFNKHESIVIKRNAFPYKWNDRDIKHDCIWINPKVEKRWNKKMIRDVCMKRYKKNEILYFFENKIEKRSILKIRHFHVIYRVDYSVCNKLKCNL